MFGRTQIATLLFFFVFIFGQASAVPLDDATAAFKSQRYAEARTLLEPLASSGVPEAQRMLGEMYFLGNGVTQNKAIAFKWTAAAANADDRLAQFSMGYMYEKGQGVAASNSLAIEFYRKSALQRYVPAMVKLADLYRSSDYGAAKYWYATAAEFGNEEAREKFARVSTREITAANEASEQRSKLRKDECASACPEGPQRYNCEHGFAEPSSCTVESSRPEIASSTNSGANALAEIQAAMADSVRSAARISNIHDNAMATMTRRNAVNVRNGAQQKLVQNQSSAPVEQAEGAAAGDRDIYEPRPNFGGRTWLNGGGEGRRTPMASRQDACRQAESDREETIALERNRVIERRSDCACSYSAGSKAWYCQVWYLPTGNSASNSGAK